MREVLFLIVAILGAYLHIFKAQPYFESSFTIMCSRNWSHKSHLGQRASQRVSLIVSAITSCMAGRDFSKGENRKYKSIIPRLPQQICQVWHLRAAHGMVEAGRI